MVSINSYVVAFNEFVRLQKDNLKACWENSSDVMVNLFKGYLATSDMKYQQYIKQQKNDYEEGKDLTEDSIMVMAANKYKSLVRTGEWNSPSRVHKEILALNAKLEKQSNKNKADSGEPKSKETRVLNGKR